MKRKLRYLAALVLLGLIAATLLFWMQTRKRGTARQQGNKPKIVVERRTPLQVQGELPTPTLEASPTPTLGIDAAAEEELRRDEQELQRSIDQIKNNVAQQIADLAASMPPLQGLSLPNSPQVVRELDFSRYPPHVVEAVMARYGLRVERRYVSRFSPNTFISRARVAGEKYFYSSTGGSPGIYEVFELTPRALEKMSTLEEEELRRRGFDPARCITKRVVFGLVETPTGQYDLGVVHLEAIALPSPGISGAQDSVGIRLENNGQVSSTGADGKLMTHRISSSVSKNSSLILLLAIRL
jgi:hypothetical protein